MSFFIFLHSLFIILLFGIGIFTYKKYKEYSGIFFIISTFCLGLWLLFYIFIFGAITNENILLYMFRIMYVFSFIGFYSMLLYVYYFGMKINKVHKKYIFIIYFLISLVFIFTPFVVQKLNFLQNKGYYFEDYGIGYNFILILYVLFIPLFLITSYFKIKSLNYINKIRLKIIVLGFSAFIFLAVVFYLILPFFGIYLFENSPALFLIPFFYSILYSTNIYNFFDFKIKLGKGIIFIISLFSTLTLINLLKYYLAKLPYAFSDFWGFSQNIGNIDLALAIFIFLMIYHFLSKSLLLNNDLIYFHKNISYFKKYIPYITNVNELNIFLQRQFFLLFKIKFSKIQLFNNNHGELYKYFSKDPFRDIFMNDIIFIEENKHKFNLDKLKKEISNDVYLIFPLFNNKKQLIGIFEIGEKPFKEYFGLEEIKIIKDFTGFLVGHLKYIEIYSKINDLNINLDKKVDQKTIEYNQLLSKQTEFISMASHEIKSPIGSCIFQLDYLLDEINDGNMSLGKVKKELDILNATLIKVGDLTNHIFSVQKYDLKKNILYKQKINFPEFLNNILFLFGKMNANVNLQINIDNTIGFLNIDKIQFTQIIDNLLNNALKFSNKSAPIISFVLKSKGNNIVILIEDNGKGFKSAENKIIFDKYVTGNTTSVGIGLGLYLCKSLVELHGGSIMSENGKDLGGAQFSIIIPYILD